MKAKHIILSLAMVSLLSASCKKFLDQQPVSTSTDETSWQSDGDANSAVASIYGLIRSAYNTSLASYGYGDLPTDEFTVAQSTPWQNVLTFNWGAAVDPVVNIDDPLLKLRLFTNYYTAIAQSNRCLSFITTMPVADFTGTSTADQTAEKNKYMGEAYFTRAFMYFNMCRVWGSVPLILDNTDATTTAQVAKAPQDTILNHVIADINKAIQYLPAINQASADRNYRADKGVAYALLAHVYAWQGKYDLCNAACDQVINSGNYVLTSASTFTNIYKGQSSESIFEIAQNTVAESTVANDPYTLSALTLTSPYISGHTGLPIWEINNTMVTTLYSDTNDVRYKNCFVQLSTGGTNYFVCTKYTNIQNINNNATYQVSLNNIVIFRLADIMLLKAEALCAKSAPDYAGALTIVNNIRANRNAALLTGITNDNVLQTVIDERGRELFLEGSRYYDLIRLERINHEQQFDGINTGEFAAGKYYWPIDPSLFTLNPKLTQTAFWAGKVN
jgi:hypothetical protein